MDVQKIEERIDKTAAGGTEVAMSLGGVRFENMMQVMEFAKLMSVAGAAVPPHLRANPGACLAVAVKALRFGFEPFALSEHSYVVAKKQKDENDRWVTVETIAYDSFVISAIIQAHAGLTGQIEYAWEGEGENRKCIVSCKPRFGAAIRFEGPTLAGIKAMRGKNDKGQTRGSPLWDSAKSDQQQAYDARRDMCRLHFPHILMGWEDKDDHEPHRGPDKAKDVTPVSSIKDRLPGTAKATSGFSTENVHRSISEVTTAAPPDPEPERKARKKKTEPVAAAAAGDAGSGDTPSVEHANESVTRGTAEPSPEIPQQGTLQIEPNPQGPGPLD